MAALNRDGSPKLNAGEIEAEIERMKSEGSRTEAWMSARARNKMQELENRDQSLRDAFEAGYRMASDHLFHAGLWGVAPGLLVASLLWYFTA